MFDKNKNKPSEIPDEEPIEVKAAEAEKAQSKRLQEIAKETGDAIDQSVGGRMELVKKRNEESTEAVLAFLNPYDPAWKRVTNETRAFNEQLVATTNQDERDALIKDMAARTENFFRKVPSETSESPETLSA